MTDTDTKAATKGLFEMVGDQIRADEGKRLARKILKALVTIENALNPLRTLLMELDDTQSESAPKTPQTEPGRKRRAVLVDGATLRTVKARFDAVEGPMTPKRICDTTPALYHSLKVVAAACRQLVQEGVLLEAGRKGYALNTIFPPSLKQENGEVEEQAKIARERIAEKLENGGAREGE